MLIGMMDKNKTIWLTPMLCATLTVAAQTGQPQVKTVKLTPHGNLLDVELVLETEGVEVRAGQALVCTPWLQNGKDSISLPAIGLYGRRRYYQYMRQGLNLLGNQDELRFRASRCPGEIDYRQQTELAPWMNGAVLKLRYSTYGCCQELMAQSQQTLARHWGPVACPQLVWAECRPSGKASHKTRQIEGRAYVSFRVNQTTVEYGYQRNSIELDRIKATIDSVYQDKDITINDIWLKGYASPEGSMAHNTLLAGKRTQALKAYVGQLYHLEENIIHTDFEAEDWQGLCAYVEKSNLAHRKEILQIAQGGEAPDEKELRIRKQYPEDYAFLRQNCYPSLRHTDYRIAYTIRNYTSVEEMKGILATEPQKLSMDEMLEVASTYQPGTEAHIEAMHKLAAHFPTQPTAYINLANDCIRKGHLAEAERHLTQAGNAPEAVYARGILAFMREDFPLAQSLLQDALAQGIQEAKPVLEEIAARTHPYISNRE